VTSNLFGDWIRELKHFGFKDTELEGIPLVVAKSGWSKQGGYELYLRDGSMGERLWDIVKEAGAPYDIGPGCPNYIERLESGLVSYGADSDVDTNPYEMGLGKFVDCDQETDFVGKDALRKIRDAGPKRRFTGYFIDGELKENAQHKWRVLRGGESIGFISATCHSPRIKANIGVGLISNSHQDEESGLVVETGFGNLPVRTTPLPFDTSTS